MANQFWVRDRVAQWLRDDPTIGASALLKKVGREVLGQVIILGCLQWEAVSS